MNIRKMQLADLFPADYNPRKALQAGDAEYEKLKRSIKQYGFVEPIIWNEATGVVVGGHQRLTVLKDLGYTEVDCVVVNLSRSQEMALNVALNKITGAWDEVKLQALFADLEGLGFDTSLTGFEPVEIDSLFKDSLKETMKQDKFDTAAAVKEPPIAKAGDLWLLGEHRIYCGSVLSGAEVLMNGNRANLVITDVSRIAPTPDFFKLLSARMSDEASIYVFHKNVNDLAVRAAFAAGDFRQSCCCYWLRPAGEYKGQTPYNEQHVPCLYGWKLSGKHQWYADRKQSTVWEISGLYENNELPIPVLGYPIINSSMRNCIVLDPCLGAGGVLVACEQLERICYGAEADVAMVSAAIKRYIDLVGSSEDVTVLRGGLEYGYEEVAK